MWAEYQTSVISDKFNHFVVGGLLFSLPSHRDDYSNLATSWQFKE
jgi:hypothetical protein